MTATSNSAMREILFGEPDDYPGHPNHGNGNRTPAPPAARTPAAAPAPKTQPITVGSLLNEIHALRDDVAQVRGQLEAATQALTLLLANQHNAPAAAPAAAPGAQQPAGAPAGSFRDFTATGIRVGASEKDGSRTYKAIGAPFVKFGVKVWPEVLPVLGITNGEALKFGDNLLARPVHVRATLTEAGQPHKVIGLAPAPAAAADDEVPF